MSEVRRESPAAQLAATVLATVDDRLDMMRYPTLGAWKVGRNWGSYHIVEHRKALCGYEPTSDKAAYTESSNIAKVLGANLNQVCKSCGRLWAERQQQETR